MQPSAVQGSSTNLCGRWCRGIRLWLLLPCFAAACVEGELGPCEQSSDCQAGFGCPATGPLAGRCAKSCSDDAPCIQYYGEASACVQGTCTTVCDYRYEDGVCGMQEPALDACAEGLECKQESPSHCASFCAVERWPPSASDQSGS